MQIRSSLFVLIFGLIEKEVGMRAHPSISATLSRISVLLLTSSMVSVTRLSKALVLALATSLTRLLCCSIRNFNSLLRDSDTSCPYLIVAVLRVVSQHTRNALEVLHTCAARDRKECGSQLQKVYNWKTIRLIESIGCLCYPTGGVRVSLRMTWGWAKHVRSSRFSPILKRRESKGQDCTSEIPLRCPNEFYTTKHHSEARFSL